MRRDQWHLRANIPTLLCLVAALAAGAADVAGAHVEWLLVHLLLLGAVTNAIVLWSAHFTSALLVSPQALGQRALAVRIVVLNIGVAAVLAGGALRLPLLLDAGAGAILAIAVLQGAALGRRLRRPRNRRWRVLVVGYLVATAYLVAGVALGVALGREPGQPLAARLLVAHLAANLLGWVGLTVASTIVQLWPTMMRIQLVPGTERAARIGLPVLAVAPAIVVAASLTGQPAAVVAGVALEVVGWVVLSFPHVMDLRHRPPRDFATTSVLAALLWLIAGSSASIVVLTQATAGDSQAGGVDAFTTMLGLGFATQIVIGALAFLAPVVLGGGPAAVRRAIVTLDGAWAVRLAVFNVGVGLLLWAPSPSAGAVGAGLVGVAIVLFLATLVTAVQRNRRVRSLPIDERAPIHRTFTDRYHP